ncbi:MAG: class B sortase, partial [Lachnospiraceae bacterium]|nr:class B sortase [Lachnospiraceae bacterium]
KIDVRQLVMIICAVVAIGSLGYFSFYNYQSSHSSEQTSNLSKIKEKKNLKINNKATVKLDEIDVPPILEDYAPVFALNQSTVGWIKIEGTGVDYPVMQTSNNDYYLNHNFDQEEDNNGSIYLDKDCSIWPRSQNLIIYGHNMKSGKMFGTLKKYKDEEFYKEHRNIQFDTLYEKGTYQILYVFNEIIHDETEVAFKYYQFISANSKEEFDSYMNEMKNMSLYDTGVEASYGDSLITLSTCDYSKNSDRFAIVAKKIY